MLYVIIHWKFLILNSSKIGDATIATIDYYVTLLHNHRKYSSCLEAYFFTVATRTYAAFTYNIAIYL